MKIGFVSRIGEFPESEWEGEFKVANEQKINHLELIMNYPHFGPLTCTDDKIKLLKELSKKYKIKLNTHLLPDYSLLKGHEDKRFDIASEDEDIRKFSIEELKRTIKIAKKLDMEYIVIHGGKYDMDKKDLKERLKTARKTLEEIDNLFKGIKLCVENLPTNTHTLKPLYSIAQNANDLLDLVIGLENIRICFDIGHANTVGDPMEFFDIIKDKVFDMHIHDNKGDGDTHIKIGKGNIDFERFIEVLKDVDYKKYFSIELDTWEGFPDSMEKKQRIEALDYFKKLIQVS